MGVSISFRNWYGACLPVRKTRAAERLIVALNLGERKHRLQLPEWARGSRLLLSTVENAALVEDGALLLGSNEAVVLEAGQHSADRMP
jgi:hypothetical protein